MHTTLLRVTDAPSPCKATMCRMLRGTLLDTGFQFFITQARDAGSSKGNGAVDAEFDTSWGSFELHVRS